MLIIQSGLSAFHEKMDYTIHGNVNGNENRNIVIGSGVVVMILWMNL